MKHTVTRSLNNTVFQNNKRNVKIIVFPLLFLLVSCVSHKSNVRNNLAPFCHLDVKQTVLPYSNDYAYVVANEYLLVFELKNKKSRTANKKILLKRKLTTKEMLDIESALKKLDNIEPHYIDDTWIDGIHWEIDYAVGETSRKIIVENMEVNVITNLFETINKLIPDDIPPLIIWEPLD